jgi:hypothetical protein
MLIISGRTKILPDGQRTKRLLLEDKEDSVNELDVFDVVVDHVVGNETLSRQLRDSGSVATYSSKGLGVADGEKQSLLEVHGDTGLLGEFTSWKDCTYTSSSMSSNRTRDPEVRIKLWI